jgi:hypothetical protein
MLTRGLFSIIFDTNQVLCTVLFFQIKITERESIVSNTYIILKDYPPLHRPVLCVIGVKTGPEFVKIMENPLCDV